MTSILAKIPIIKPKKNRAYIEVKEYDAYRFGDNLPESVFQGRVDVLKELVADKFPYTHRYFDYGLVLTLITGFPFIFVYAYFNQGHSKTDNEGTYTFGIPVVAGVAILPFALYWFFYLGLVIYLRRKILAFKLDLEMTLKNFTADDMPTRNIKYIAKHYVPARGVAHSDGQALIHFVVFIVRAGAEAEVEALPLYSAQNEDVIILEAGPPDYEELEMQPVGSRNVAMAGVDDHLLQTTIPIITTPMHTEISFDGNHTPSSSTEDNSPGVDLLRLHRDTVTQGDSRTSFGIEERDDSPLTRPRPGRNGTLPPAYTE